MVGTAGSLTAWTSDDDVVVDDVVVVDDDVVVDDYVDVVVDDDVVVDVDVDVVQLQESRKAHSGQQVWPRPGYWPSDGKLLAS